MNPRPLLRSASFDYRSTGRQVKNRIGRDGSRFAVHASRFTVTVRGCRVMLPSCVNELGACVLWKLWRISTPPITVARTGRNREPRTGNREPLSMRENLRKKLACAVCLRIVKKGLFWPVFDYFATVHEDNSIGDPFGKTHLMSDH